MESAPAATASRNLPSRSAVTPRDVCGMNTEAKGTGSPLTASTTWPLTTRWARAGTALSSSAALSSSWPDIRLLTEGMTLREPRKKANMANRKN